MPTRLLIWSLVSSVLSSSDATIVISLPSQSLISFASTVYLAVSSPQSFPSINNHPFVYGNMWPDSGLGGWDSELVHPWK